AQQGWRGGRPRPAGGGWRQRGGAGQQRYQDTIRRVTAGPRATAPSHQLAGEPIAGPHAILEAMRAGRGIRRVYVSEDRGTRTGAVNDLITEAQQRRIFVRFVDKMEIDRLSPIEEKGVWVVAADESGDLLYDEVDYRGPTAIVIGGEGEGIRRLVLEGCDQVVRIPMEGQVSSLNAAAAGTVLLYEALRQRRHNVPPAQ